MKSSWLVNGGIRKSWFIISPLFHCLVTHRLFQSTPVFGSLLMSIYILQSDKHWPPPWKQGLNKALLGDDGGFFCPLRPYFPAALQGCLKIQNVWSPKLKTMLVKLDGNPPMLKNPLQIFAKRKNTT